MTTPATPSAPRQADRPAPLLIALPKGMETSGIVSWARTLAAALVEMPAREGTGNDRAVSLIVHEQAHPYDRTLTTIDRRVRVHRVVGAPDLDSCNGEYGPYIDDYRRAIIELHRESGRPVACVPTYTAECWGLFAQLSQEMPKAMRVLSWQHSDIPYDYQTLRWFEPLSAGFVGVSAHIALRLRDAMPARAGDVHHVPYGVRVPAAPPSRAPLNARPLRLIYTGRLEHPQKRIGALAELSRLLCDRGVNHELLLVGDGPAAPQMRDAARGNPCLRLHNDGAPASADEISTLLSQADVFVLASRYEGLSVSMLEAMAHACVPVVTRVRSGAGDAIDHGRSGVLVDAAPTDSDSEVARSMADAVRALLELGEPSLCAMSRAAWQTAHDRFCVEVHARAAARVIDLAAHAPARCWPEGRECSPSRGDAGGSMSVPPDAAARAAAALAALAPGPVALWGGGRHTRALEAALRASPAPVVGVIEDDPARWGERCAGVAVMSADDALSAGVRAVLISSWMHESDMWEKRERFTRSGVEVVRLYGR